MKSIKSLERKLGRFAIPDLTLYLVGGQGLALMLSLAMPGMVSEMLLMPDAVLAGQWWRLLSFLFTPPFSRPVWAIFALYLLYFMGGALEAHWGALRYNLYVLIGYLMTIAATFVFHLGVAANTYITGSIFLAFAYLFPDYVFYLFFILPVRVKWLALLTWLSYGYTLVVGDWTARTLIVAAVANFLLFFGRDIVARIRYGHRHTRQQARAIASRDQPLHVCTVCAVTDKSNRTMEFRYCTKCEPPVAYCMDHLGNHPHRHSGPSA